MYLSQNLHAWEILAHVKIIAEKTNEIYAVMKKPVFDDAWSDEVKRVYEHDMQEIWDASIASDIFNMYQSQLEMYQSLVPMDAREILDVGCAQATLALLLAENGYNVTAIDLRESFLTYAKSRWSHGNIDFVQGNAFEIELGKKFDVIFANQILEHLFYPKEFVVKLASFLKPGGIIIMTTPNGEYIRSGLPSFTALGNPKEWQQVQFTADGDGHFFAYTAPELVSVFNEAGLSSINVQSYETPWISGHMKFRYLHKFMPYLFLRVLDKLTKSIPFGERFCHQLLVTGTQGRVSAKNEIS